MAPALEPPERRDGFRIVSLVMSIIFPHIVISEIDGRRERVGTGRAQAPPGLEEKNELGV